MRYTDEKFADLQMLRYRLEGFERLTPRQRLYVYCLAKAALYGRDITFDQHGKYNLPIRKVLENLYVNYAGDKDSEDYRQFVVYLKRLWFSNGIYHHYGCEKFVPGFSADFLRQNIPDIRPELVEVICNPAVLPKRVNQAAGTDLVKTSACNFYENVTQQEVETFYQDMKKSHPDSRVSWGLNSKVVKSHEHIHEEVYSTEGLYSKALTKIVEWLGNAAHYAENDSQREVLGLLCDYYRSGSLETFDDFSVAWVRQHEGDIDFINGFIEVYGDPLGLKGTWEGLVEYTDPVATRRTETISRNAQWFEDHSPVDARFKKKTVRGVSAHAIHAAMLGGDEYPSTAIGINLPNADWIRAEYGSKSVTISNITDAYNQAAKGNGFREEFVIDSTTRALIDRYGDLTDELHTDLHECLGHGSGQLLPGTDPDALKAYGNTIEEARADLFGLYYIADPKLVELGLTPDGKAYQSQYYTYLMNGALTQCVRIEPGHDIEEAHMRNRALIANWVLEKADEEDVPAAEIVTRDGKHYLQVNDYDRLRTYFGQLLGEIQRIKSTGDYDAARNLVERYGVRLNPEIHREMRQRYQALDIAPYKGFINPRLNLVRDDNGQPVDVTADYTERYDEQMLRYSQEYATLI